MDDQRRYDDRLASLRDRLFRRGLGRVADRILIAARPGIWLRQEPKPALEPFLERTRQPAWSGPEFQELVAAINNPSVRPDERRRIAERLRQQSEQHAKALAADYRELRPTLLVDHLPVGQSKLGGVPDLPSDVAWPEWNGYPMSFIAQVRLDGAAPYDAEGLLPRSGLLSFFFATTGEPRGNDADDDPSTWRVLHLPDIRALHRLEAPPEQGDYRRFLPTAVTFDRKPTLPDVDDPEIVALSLARDERAAYVDVRGDQDLPEPRPGTHLAGDDSHLLGYAVDLGSHALLTSELASSGRLDLLTSRDKAGTLRRIAAADERWQLLLQVDSSEPAEMDWAGGGLLYFTIPRAALRQGDFSQVWVVLDFL